MGSLEIHLHVFSLPVPEVSGKSGQRRGRILEYRDLEQQRLSSVRYSDGQ
jgi:hypothetical protein